MLSPEEQSLIDKANMRLNEMSREEAERRMIDAIESMTEEEIQAKIIPQQLQSVIDSNYMDELELDEAGQPLLRRTTAIHHAARRGLYWIVWALFIAIYNANYVDETGLTHFHLACRYNFGDVVERFIREGVHPDCLPRDASANSVDPPIFLAAANGNADLMELLFLNGADPNLRSRDNEETAWDVYGRVAAVALADAGKIRYSRKRKI
ncbi:unnamed protein product [Trichogramma brassicae]|uniref:Uncharacterized protein n=1 Tax=Trichogramma brassicae TaxID=86971 RepID=A0A6H5IQN4_9HYME|nr:unnamed protein product [Trichogramma brassicae]